MRRETSKCIEWNAKRYNQEYDYNLAVKLLLEETNELFASDTIVDVLDAVGDITFVAVGVMWKLAIPDHKIKSYFYDNNLSVMSPEECYNLCCIINNDFTSKEEGAYPGLHLACFSVFVTAISALRGIGMQASFYDIFDAICDSNNTKVVKGKTAANIKANINKGSSFIPPTERLQVIKDQYMSIEGMVKQ